MGFLNDTGDFAKRQVLGAGFTVDLLQRTFVQSVFVPRKLRALTDQMFIMGVKTIPVVSVVAVFAGMILSLQTGIELQKLSQQGMIGNIVAISMCREMGPFITGLILAATIGSAVAAEIGTMAVSEEIEALEVMSVDPVRYLVMPRVIALAIMCPLLTILANCIGILGGGLVAQNSLGVTWQYFWNSVVSAMTKSASYLPKDIYVGLFKSLVFGVSIATVGCSSGLRAGGGALGVGRAVQQAVVNSVLLIIILGYLITWFFYIFLG